MMTFGEALQKARLNIGFTAKELAEKVSVGANTVSRWETGRREPDLETIKKISEVLQVPISYLMGDTESDETCSEEKHIYNPISGSISQLEKEGKLMGQNQLLMIPRISPEVKLSAGMGNGYESLDFEVIGKYAIFDGRLSALYSDNSLTCMNVEGDSMEPQIHDGDMVVFNHCSDWLPGGIYVVCLEGRMLVKGLIDNGRGSPPILRSSNKEYPDIVVREEQFFIIYGRVLKILTDRAPKPII